MSDRIETDLALPPAVAEILSSLADGRIEDALAGINGLSRRLGGIPVVFHLVGLASLRLNEPGKAVEAFLSAHNAAPDLREYSEALSIVMSKVGRLVDSLYYKKLSIAATRESDIPGLLPDWMGNFAEAFRNIAEAPLMKAATAAFARGDYAAAAEFFQKETEVAPDSVEAWHGLARAHLLANQPFQAVAAAEQLVLVGPDEAGHHALLGRCLAHAGRFDEALAVHRRAEALRPLDADLAWGTIVTAAERPGIALAELTRHMVRWGERFTARREPAPARRELGARRIRLGILSAHWAEGDGLDTLVPVIELLDRKRIELFCYAAGVVDAPLAIRVRQRASTWCDLRDLDDDTARVIVANDDLDLLIDLDGPTRCARPALFAARPAALALSAYGIAEGAQALGFDGVIGDAAADAPGIVLRVPGGIAALPSNLQPLARPERETRPTVFGSLAHGWQISAETVAAWGALLAAAPETLLVLDLERLGGLEAAHSLATRFGSVLPPDRVLTFDGRVQQTPYFFAVDLLLDPLDNPQPEEALASITLGTPVITCRSEMPRASLLATWLETAGLAELVAADPAGYVAAAASLSDPVRREALGERIAALVRTELADGAARQAARLGAVLHAAVTGSAA